MRRIGRLLLLMAGMLAATLLPGKAESVCSELVVEPRIEAVKKELKLGELLSHDTCSQFQHAASQVSLCAAPQAGSVRVLEGRQVRQLLAGLEAGESNSPRSAVRMKIPERVVVERAAETKSCGQIAQVVASKASQQDLASFPRGWQDQLNCSGGRAVSKDATLELSRAVWNKALRRWEFALRCTQAAKCIPFLVWAPDPKSSTTLGAGFEEASRFSNSGLRSDLRSDVHFHPGVDSSRLADSPQAAEEGDARLVKPGQTVSLEWEQRGIRVVLPAICLDAGGMGEFVRVRFKNASGVLRAEVVGEGRLRAQL